MRPLLTQTLIGIVLSPFCCNAQFSLPLDSGAFVDTHILPLESDRANYDDHENIHPDVLKQVQVKARTAGLWALSMPVERGGRGFDTVGMAACYEEMNRSIFGPVCFNAAAPDDGNMLVLNKT